MARCRSPIVAPSTPAARVETVNDAAECLLAGLDLSPKTVRTYRHGTVAFLRYLHEAHGSPRDAATLAPAPVSWIDEEVLPASTSGSAPATPIRGPAPAAPRAPRATISARPSAC